MVSVVLTSARTGSKMVRRPWFGARLQPVSSDLTESLGLDRPIGALVASVVEKGPAAEAGLKPTDVILAVDGKRSTTRRLSDSGSRPSRWAARPN